MRPWDQEARRSLSSAVSRGDLEQMMEVIADRRVGEVAHLLAPLLIAALKSDDQRARPVAIECIPHLEAQGGTVGDRVLATRLRQSLEGDESDLRMIPDLDLDAVASSLDDASYDFGFALNVETGEWKLVSELEDDIDYQVWLELWNWDGSSESGRTWPISPTPSTTRIWPTDFTTPSRERVRSGASRTSSMEPTPSRPAGTCFETSDPSAEHEPGWRIEDSGPIDANLATMCGRGSFGP